MALKKLPERIALKLPTKSCMVRMRSEHSYPECLGNVTSNKGTSTSPTEGTRSRDKEGTRTAECLGSCIT